MNSFSLGQESQPREITYRGYNEQAIAQHVRDIFRFYKEVLPAVNQQSYAKFKIMKFTTTAQVTLDFPTIEQLRPLCLDKIKRFCIIQQYSKPHIFYLVVTFFGYANRKILSESFRKIIDQFISPSSQTRNVAIESFNGGHQNLQQVYTWLNQIIKNDETYIKVDFNQASAEDELEIAKLKAQAQLNIELNQLKECFQKEFIIQFKSLTTFGAHQKGTFMEDLVKMSEYQFGIHCLNTLPQNTLMKAQNIAYDYAAQSPQLTNLSFYQTHKETIADPLTKQELIRNIMGSQPILHELFQRCYYGRHDGSARIIHPHPLTAFMPNMKNYAGKGVIELMPFSQEYLKNMLLIATWFNNTILRQPEEVNRQHSVLCLYGTGGSGKSTINNTFKEAFNGYLWIMQGEFQAPDIGYTSLIVVEDTSIEKLDTERLKQITDFQSTCKVQYKQAHPVDISYRCPVVVSSNDDINDKLMNIRGDESKKASRNALGQRLFPVKFTENFDETYTLPVLEEDDVVNEQVALMKKPNKTTLFNTIVGLALIMHNGYNKIQAPLDLYGYFDQCVKDMLNTAFGRMIYQQHMQIQTNNGLDSKIAKEIKDFEKLPFTENIELQKEIGKMKSYFFSKTIALITDEITAQNCLSMYFNSSERAHIGEMMIITTINPYLSLDSLRSFQELPGDDGMFNPILKRQTYQLNKNQPCLSLRSQSIQLWYRDAQQYNIFEMNQHESTPENATDDIVNTPSPAKPKKNLEEEKVPPHNNLIGKRRRDSLECDEIIQPPVKVIKLENIDLAEQNMLFDMVYKKNNIVDYVSIHDSGFDSSDDDGASMMIRSLADPTPKNDGVEFDQANPFERMRPTSVIGEEDEEEQNPSDQEDL